MSTRTVYSLIGVCLAGTFLFDCLTPLGYQEFLLYALPILLTLWLEQAWSAYVVAGLATFLVYAGWGGSPAGIPAEVALLNRTLSALLFWVIAELVIRSRGAILDRGARQLAALVNSSVDAIISQDLTGTVMTWNAAAERMFGYGATDIVGRSLHVLIPAHRIQQDIAAYASIGRGEAVAQYETVWTHRGGRLIELSLSLSPILNQSGEVVGISTIAHDIAPLKATMQSLREHEARLDLVVSATRTGVWDWDLRAHKMYYSPLWKESLGYGPDELTDSPSEWETRLHPEDRERALALVQAFFAGEIPTYELEHRLRHRDGTYRWIHTDAVLIRDEQGLPIRMTGSHVDVTDQKRAQEALRQSEERFRRYFELGLIGMAMTSPDKRWIDFNDQLCTILGYSREELQQLTWADLTVPEDLNLDNAQFERVLAGEVNGYSLEKRFVHKSGRVVHTVISSNAVPNREGSVEYFVALVHDITDRKAAEALLKESEGTLQAFFDSASLMMGVVEVLDDDIRHLSSNRATARFFGTTQEGMNGRLCSELGVPRELARLWLHHYHLCIKEQSPIRFEYEHRDKRGGKIERRSLLATVSLIGRGADGTARCSFIVDDVTEWRKAEDLLREAHALLERRVAERTAELGNATVRARTLAQRLFDVQEAERRAVAQDLHDEIGQVLTALKLNLQQVQRDGIGGGTSNELHESIEISDQLLARVRNLALDLRPSLLDDLGLVPALRWFATRQAERAGWVLQLHLDETPLTLTAPRSIACFRVVQEAMTNIARHARAKSVLLSLSVTPEQVRMVVQDDGCGFDEAAIRSRAQQGLSMGMLGMEERVSLVGGSMTVRSTVGQGTSLVISVPLTGPQQEAVAQ